MTGVLGVPDDFSDTSHTALCADDVLVDDVHGHTTSPLRQHLGSTPRRDQLVNIRDMVILENSLRTAGGWSHFGACIVVPSWPVRLCFHKSGETICDVHPQGHSSADDLQRCDADEEWSMTGLHFPEVVSELLGFDHQLHHLLSVGQVVVISEETHHRFCHLQTL